MDLLQGIQEIPGQTPGEKFKHINLTAKDIADKKCQDVKFPKQLEPLLNVEVAKLSHETKVIIDALITSNSLLCQHALQIPDLFPGEDSPLLNWEYFNNQLLSQVSFTTRCKIIKKLETNLQSKDPKVAEEFYLNISKIYGGKHAHPLLFACSEHFIVERIEKDNLVLSIKKVAKLFQKFPTLVTRYLMMLRDKKPLELEKLKQFLPNLVHNHFQLFVTLCDEKLSLQLGKRRTKIFLKKGKQLLIEKPKMFLKILCLEIVSAKLSMDEFATMLSNLLVKKMSDFNFFSVRDKLKFFPPEKQCSLILAAFKKAYGEDLCDHPELVDQCLLLILPTELRIKVATMKLEKDSNWNLHEREESWRAYLPFNNIFEDVKTQILKCSDANERLGLIKLLVFCCKVNNDTDGLLQVLKYTQVRHKNEKCNSWSNLLRNISYNFKLEKLNQEHWDIFIEILQKLELSGISNFPSTYTLYLPQGIKFKFFNKLDPEEYMKYYLKLMITNWPHDFDIFLSDNLELQKVCLMKFMDLIVDAYLLYSKEDDVAQDYRALNYLFNSINRYNKMAESKSEGLPLLKLEDHPSLLEFVEGIIVEKGEKYHSNVNKHIRLYHPELYSKWYPDDKNEPPITTLKEDMKLLKKDFPQFVSNWDTYVNKIVDSDKLKTTRRYVKVLRWYQDLPIKLATFCLSLVNDPDKYKSLALLGILYESSEFQELIKQLVPQTFTIDLKDETSVKHQKQAKFYFEGMKFTNPPLPLNFFKQFFTSDYLPLCVPTLDHTVSRTPVLSVINFVSTSLNDRVAVVKKLINLIPTTAPIEDQCRIYRTILHSNTHSSIHGCIILKVLKLFKSNPNEDAWNLLTECIDKKLIEDERILKKLVNLNGVEPISISDKYLETYVKRMMLILEKVEIDGRPDLPNMLIGQLINQLNNEEYSQVLSVDFQIQLIKDHIFESQFNNKPMLLESFIFVVFLRDRSQQRIDIFLNMLKDYVKTYFGKPLQENDCDSYPANCIIKYIMIKFASLTVKQQLDVTIVNILLEFFEGPMAPYQDMKSYLFLNWAKMYSTLLDPMKFGIEFGKNLDGWLRSFGSAFLFRMVEIVKSFLTMIVDGNKFIKKECLSKFISGLREVKTENCYLTIVMLLNELDESPKKKNIVEELKKIAIPAVQIFVNEYMYGTE